MGLSHFECSMVLFSMVAVIALLIDAIVLIGPIYMGWEAEPLPSVPDDDDMFMLAQSVVSVTAVQRDGGKETFVCSGILQTPVFVLTSAQCLEDNINGTRRPLTSLRLNCGENNMKLTRTVSRATVHSEYDANFLTNDVALLKMDLPFQYGDVVIGGIPIVKRRPRMSQNGIQHKLLSWNPIEWEYRSILFPNIRKATVILMKSKDCATAYKRESIDSNQFCGITTGSMGSCDLSVGSPMVVQEQLVGIVSEPTNCRETPDKPVIYTNVIPYTDWIKEHIDEASID